MIDQSRLPPPPGESRDGLGAGDNDLPFLFGHGPHCDTTPPFTVHQFARLLVLRGRLHEGFLLRDRGRHGQAEPAE